jgi:hypothetical protein
VNEFRAAAIALIAGVTIGNHKFLAKDRQLSKFLAQACTTRFRNLEAK